MSKRIMLVDDAAFLRQILRKYLTESEKGYEVCAEASDGRAAIEIYKEFYQKGEKPDLVIMDITMPDIDGMKALKEIRKIDKDAKVMMCTALTPDEKVVESALLGASDFIKKPFQREGVLDKINKIFT